MAAVVAEPKVFVLVGILVVLKMRRRSEAVRGLPLILVRLRPEATAADQQTVVDLLQSMGARCEPRVVNKVADNHEGEVVAGEEAVVGSEAREGGRCLGLGGLTRASWCGASLARVRVH